MKKELKICIVGLGYVGLPLAIEFSKKYLTIAYDKSKKRVSELKNNNDKTLEVDSSDLKRLKISEAKLKNSNSGLYITDNLDDNFDCNVYIITVPTPVDNFNNPDLNPLISASTEIGGIIKKNDIVIYESTVYPGLTEEVCVPILEKTSGLVYNKDFSVGYSPERINPGDKKRTLTKIVKVTSGSNKKAGKLIDKMYNSIIDAGTHLAPSIKVAEAAKVIENSQRDINIAFVNELAKIFNLMNIETNDVLAAASTKWNFLDFKPGLVGGHCIGVDPYYLANKSIQLGYNPEIILSGRRLNDSMGKFISTKILKLMVNHNININLATVLILGFTFKENCPDVRNTKVFDLYKGLIDFGINVDIFDPHISKKEVKRSFQIDIMNKKPNKKYDVIILAVSHDEFIDLNTKKLLKNESFIYDIKGFFGAKADYRL